MVTVKTRKKKQGTKNKTKNALPLDGFRFRFSGQQTGRVPNAVSLRGNISYVWNLIGVANGAYVSGMVRVVYSSMGSPTKNAYIPGAHCEQSLLRNLF